MDIKLLHFKGDVKGSNKIESDLAKNSSKTQLLPLKIVPLKITRTYCTIHFIKSLY